MSFLADCRDGAVTAGHIFPEYAACEAALESGFGKSKLATEDFNLFGVKQHTHPVYGTIHLPTREFLNNAWVVVDAAWVKYPDLASCFKDRMDTLKRLSGSYPHYAAALAAPDGETFVREVSKSWSTDPERANKVLRIHELYSSQFVSEAPATPPSTEKTVAIDVPESPSESESKTSPSWFDFILGLFKH